MLHMRSIFETPSHPAMNAPAVGSVSECFNSGKISDGALRLSVTWCISQKAGIMQGWLLYKTAIAEQNRVGSRLNYTRITWNDLNSAYTIFVNWR